MVPADLRLLRADRLLVDRSVLAGESIPEEGRVDPDTEATPLAGRRAMAYSGTSVVGGRGEGAVVTIGRATEFGRIAGGLASRERRCSPLQRELDRLVRILLVVAIGLIAFTTGMGLLRGHPLGENIPAGISAAIAAIPEEPPILLAVILGLGAYRLLKRGVLVRRLNAEETLGAVDLNVTDKTGPSVAPSVAPSVVDPTPVIAEPPMPVGGQEQPQVVLVAEGITFVPTEITVRAGVGFTIGMDNRDPGIPHSIEIFGPDGIRRSLRGRTPSSAPSIRTWRGRSPPSGGGCRRAIGRTGPRIGRWPSARMVPGGGRPRPAGGSTLWSRPRCSST